jgi:hypothetical protein
MATREISIRATEHPNAYEAIQHLSVSGDEHAILVGDKYLTTSKAEVEKIDRAGIEFAYLIDHEATGRIMTVPINDR